MAKTFDVAIPVYRPDKHFFTLIERLCKQEELPKKLILMNTECEECTKEQLRDRVEDVFRYALLKSQSIELLVIAVEKDSFDHGGTRHLSTNYSTSDYLLFMTQDAVPKNRTLTKELLFAFEAGKSSKVAVAYARQCAKKQATPVEKLTREFNYPDISFVKSKADLDTLGIKTYFCSDACAMYDMRLYRTLGGFVRKTIFNEDMLYAAKAVDAGYSIYYCAEAKVIHSHCYTYIEELRRSFDLGVSQAQHPEIFLYVSSQKEGVRFVKSTVKKLLGKCMLIDLFDFGLRCVMKYVGFLLGKNYRMLPKQCLKKQCFLKQFIEKLSMNRNFWK